MPFGSPMLLKTISTNPLARLLQIAFWRCIAFLISWDTERKRTTLQIGKMFIKLCSGFKDTKNERTG